MQKAVVEAGYVRGEPRRMNGGWNVSDMLRDLIHEISEQRGWGLRELAREIQEDRSALYRFMSGVGEGVFPEGKIGLITSLCARLNISVSELFSMHPCGKPREGNAQHLADLQVGPVNVLRLLHDAHVHGRLEEAFGTLWTLTGGEPPSSPSGDKPASK